MAEQPKYVNVPFSREDWQLIRLLAAIRKQHTSQLVATIVRNWLREQPPIGEEPSDAVAA